MSERRSNSRRSLLSLDSIEGLGDLFHIRLGRKLRLPELRATFQSKGLRVPDATSMPRNAKPYIARLLNEIDWADPAQVATLLTYAEESLRVVRGEGQTLDNNPRLGDLATALADDGYDVDRQTLTIMKRQASLAEPAVVPPISNVVRFEEAVTLANAVADVVVGALAPDVEREPEVRGAIRQATHLLVVRTAAQDDEVTAGTLHTLGAAATYVLDSVSRLPTSKRPNPSPVATVAVSAWAHAADHAMNRLSGGSLQTS